MELYGLREDAVIARELNRPVSSVRKMAERLFPQVRTAGPWTAVDVERLKHYLGATTEEVIARVLGKTPDQVRERILDLGRIQKDGGWARQETIDFKRLYGTRTDEDLSRIFGRSLEAIQAHALELALSKDKAFLRKLCGADSTRMPRWASPELEILRRDYPTCSNLEIAHVLGRSVKSVVSKAHNMELKKSTDRLREMGRENVRRRYQE
jgi:hypothetical protein